MKKYLPSPGEIWLVDLGGPDDVVGHEIYKCRPAIVISPSYRIYTARMATIVPIASNPKKFPTHIPIDVGRVHGMMFIEHNRSVDLKRFVKKLEDATPDILSAARKAVMDFNGGSH